MQNEDPSSHDAQTLDSATADQAQEQEKANFPEMHSDGEDEEEDSEMKTVLFEENEELPVSVVSYIHVSVWGIGLGGALSIPPPFVPLSRIKSFVPRATCSFCTGSAS